MSESLRDILEKFKEIDSDLPPEDFRPEEIIGDIKNKVDAIKWRIDSWNAEAAELRNWVKSLNSRIGSLEGKAEKLKEYMKFQMIENGFEKIPGQLWRVQVQRIADKVEFLRAAGPSDLLAFPDLVKQEVSYRWDSKKVAEQLDQKAPLSFAVTKPNKALKFYAQAGEKK